MEIFTFGRQREKKCSLAYLDDPNQAHLIHAVIDAVHDLLEGGTTEEAIRPVLFRAFSEGGAGVWEQTGGWLRKLIPDFPSLQSLWLEFAGHPHWKVRFRVACFINEMPSSLANEIGNQLKADRSKKVRDMARSRLIEIASPSRKGQHTEHHQKIDTSEAESKWAGVTKRRCPECGSLCPEYRTTCRVCGFEIGRHSQ